MTEANRSSAGTGPRATLARGNPRGMMAVRAAYWVWRRELHVMLRAPILYVVGGVFLVVQGVAFAGLVNALSDPRKPAPLGELLEGQLAGTLLTWVLSLVVLTLLGMRTIAEDKRSGAWELLLTARVGEGAAVIGKWLAASSLYALLWLPTLAYFIVVAMYRADGGGWDVAAIACGYLGAIAIGAALLAWAIAASAAMGSLLGAGALGFALLIGIFLVGELPALWPDLATDEPSAAAALEAVSVRATALAFARGEIVLRSAVFVGGLAVIGLSLAIALACVGRRRRRELRLRVLGTIALAACALFGGVLAVRHPVRWDATDDGRNSLDATTLDVLAALPGPTQITIVRPTFGPLAPIYEEVVRVVDRMAEHAPAVTVRSVDPATVPGGLAAVARASGFQPQEVAASGAVVVEVGGRRRVVDAFALGSFDPGPQGEVTVERLAIEQAISAALAALSRSRTVTACTTTGHGELPLDTRDDNGADWTLVADRLRAEAIAIEPVAVTNEVPRRCDVLVVAGPASPLSPAEALAIQAYVRDGGALVVAAAVRTLSSGQGATGLDGVLASAGLGLPAAIAVDPSLTVRELPGTLLVNNGYTDHPINDGFRGTRTTLWFQPRAVVTTGAATPLVRATAASWGETNLGGEQPAKQESDLAGPVTLAALGHTHRVIAIGSAESFMTSLLSSGASAADLWLARATRFLAGAPDPKVDVAARTPDQLRLVLTTAQRRTIIALCVGGIPLAWTLIGAALVWWRRRRATEAGA